MFSQGLINSFENNFMNWFLIEELRNQSFKYSFFLQFDTHDSSLGPIFILMKKKEKEIFGINHMMMVQIFDFDFFFDCIQQVKKNFCESETQNKGNLKKISFG